MNKKRLGFTLIELLVVVAIIAVLVAILLPALSRAREQTKKIVCGANVKQIGQAFFYYGNDFNDMIPRNNDNSVSFNSSGEWYSYGRWFQQISKYVQIPDVNSTWDSNPNNLGRPDLFNFKKSVMFCPNYQYVFYDTWVNPYGYNGELSNDQSHRKKGNPFSFYKKFSEINQAAKTSMIGDGEPSTGWMSELLNGPMTDVWDGSGTITWFGGFPSARHLGGLDFVCVDGHVEWRSYNDFLRDNWFWWE